MYACTRMYSKLDDVLCTQCRGIVAFNDNSRIREKLFSGKGINLKSYIRDYFYI